MLIVSMYMLALFVYYFKIYPMATYAIGSPADVELIMYLMIRYMVDSTSAGELISNNETPTVRGLAADNNNKLYTETMIFL